MEVVEGETLAERISRGPIPLKAALEIALPIAEALEAAHERGILHRDLKPSNVKLTPGGGVKILDFGLAKALEVSESAATLPKPVEKTGSGVAIGTAPYMSPEQARGGPVSKRTDVWAFGCVLYEMLTGRKAFPGATWSDSIAAVLEREPDWRSLPLGTPPGLQRLLKRCLQKEQKERLRDFADTKLELKDLLIESSPEKPAAVGRRPGGRWKSALGVIAILAALGVLLVLRKAPAPSAGLRKPRFQLTLPREVNFAFRVYATLAISPDGSRMAFVGCGESCQLYVREISEIDARPLPGTEDASGPFFSADGRWMGFAAQGKLKKIDLKRGTVVTLAEAPSLRGASWGEDGTIFFATGSSGLLRVSAEGGEVDQVTTPEAGEHDHRWPQILPGGRAVLFEVLQDSAFISPGSRGHDVAIVDLETGGQKKLIESAGSPKYASSGHILFGRDGVVYAAPFDPERFELLRSPSPVLEDVAMSSSPSVGAALSGVVSYDLSREGTLLFSPLEARLPKRTLVTLDRKGAREALSPLQRAYHNLQYSPDGRRIAVTVRADTSVWDAFVLDMRSGAWTRVNVPEEVSASPRSERPYWVAAWMPDGERLLLSDGLGMLLVAVDGGDETERFSFAAIETATSVSPDASAFLAAMQPRPEDWDIWRVALTGVNAAEPWLATPSREEDPIFSPDGRWVAYESNDSGRGEIYVRAYMGSAVRHQVSTRGGRRSRWSRDGREIFFLSGGSLWSASVQTSPAFDAEGPQKLFDVPDDIERRDYDVSPDGQRFLMIQRDPLELRPLDLVVVPGWVEEMKSRLASTK